MQLIGTCIRGFEEYAAQEAKILGCKVIETRQSRIIIEGEDNCLYILNNYSRTLNKVMILLARDIAFNLDDIYRKAHSIDYSFIKPDQKFAVRSERSGVHDFTSIDIARVVGQAIIDSYLESKGIRLKVDLENPDLEINADLINNELFISINTTGNGLNFREYRVYNHPSSLKPTLAAALIIMSGWDGSKLVDAFTGGGTIPIEAVLYALSKPVKPSGFFLYKKLSFYDEEKEQRAISFISKKFEVKKKLAAIEISPKHIKGAEKNAVSAGVIDYIDFMLDDSVKVVLEEKARYLVSNPPYGIRSGRKEKVLKIYELFVKNLENILEEGGQGVIITTEYTKLAEMLKERGYKIIKTNVGLHGKLWVGAVLFKS